MLDNHWFVNQNSDDPTTSLLLCVLLSVFGRIREEFAEIHLMSLPVLSVRLTENCSTDILEI